MPWQLEWLSPRREHVALLSVLCLTYIIWDYKVLSFPVSKSSSFSSQVYSSETTHLAPDSSERFVSLQDESVIWTRDVDDEQLNKDIVDVCLWVEKNKEGVKSSNREGYHGPRDFHQMENAAVQQLCDRVESFVEEIMTSYVGAEENQVRVKIRQSWVNINRGKAKNVYHTHGTEYVSVVFYAKPLETSSILFKEDRNFEGGKVKADRAGKLVAFPSHLYHSVPPSKAKSARISIAFNVKVDVNLSNPVQIRSDLMAAEIKQIPNRIVLGQTVIYKRDVVGSSLLDTMQSLQQNCVSRSGNAVQPTFTTFPVMEKSIARGGDFTIEQCSSTEETQQLSRLMGPFIERVAGTIKESLGVDGFKHRYVSRALLQGKGKPVRVDIVKVESMSVSIKSDSTVDSWHVPLGVVAPADEPVTPPESSPVTVFAVYLSNAINRVDHKSCALVFQDRRMRSKNWKWVFRKTLSNFNAIVLPKLYGLGKSMLPIEDNHIYIFTNPGSIEQLVQQALSPGVRCEWWLVEMNVYIGDGIIVDENT